MAKVSVKRSNAPYKHSASNEYLMPIAPWPRCSVFLCGKETLRPSRDRRVGRRKGEGTTRTNERRRKEAKDRARRVEEGGRGVGGEQLRNNKAE